MFHMDLSREVVQDLVERELSGITDSRVIARLRALLVSPYAVEREWYYGLPGQTYICWTVLEHKISNTGIAYCADGFGPDHPWGLVFLTGPRTGIGMDSGWLPTLEQALKETMAWEEDGSCS